MIKTSRKYIVWIVVLGVCYLSITNMLFGTLFFTALIMFVLSASITPRLLKAIDIKIELDKKSVIRGNSNKLNIHVFNKSIFPTNKLYLKIKVSNNFFDECEEFYINVPVSIRGNDIMSFSVKCPYVGNVILEVSTLKIVDYLRIFSYEKELSKRIYWKVMPENINYNILIDNFYTESDEGEKKLITVDSTEFRGVRQYKEGESLQHIHWKLSSKYDELMVKEFEMSVENNYIFLLDLVKGKNEYLNDAIDVLYSILNNIFTTSKKGITVNWYDEKTGQYVYYNINEMEEVEGMIDYIYSTSLSKESGMVYHSYLAQNGIIKDTDCIYITLKEDTKEGNVLGIYNDKVVLKCI